MIGFGSGFELLEAFEIPFQVLSFGFEVKLQLVAFVERGEFDDFEKFFHFPYK